MSIVCNDDKNVVDLSPTHNKSRYGCADIPAAPQDGRLRVELRAQDEPCRVDGFFVCNEPVEMPDNVHTLDAIVGRSEAGKAAEGPARSFRALRAPEPAFEPGRCFDSNTLVTTVHIANSGAEEREVRIGETVGKEPLDNPPLQRYTLPGQKFGVGVTTTAGGLAWKGTASCAQNACFYEWYRGRSRGRRLLATLVWVCQDVGACEDSEASLPAVLRRSHPILVPAGGSVSAAVALNMRRFTLDDTWNPEITPELYKKETEQEAVEAGYRACVEALSGDHEQAIRRSIEPYGTFPKASLPEKSWEADFYACLELPRASTFSPVGGLETPFYNFCRVHAHEPFDWWSYGMHAHEDLCTLFTDITDPELSADFLRGHIRCQREDGMYPYGVSHATNPRLTTQEATAPLIVWEAWLSYLWSGDRKFLREAYESGKRSHEWWLSTRDRCGEGLCHWLNTSGESVRDDDALPTWQVTGGGQYQEALDLNCYLLVQERALSEMARELGLAKESEHYHQMADRRARVMTAHIGSKRADVRPREALARKQLGRDEPFRDTGPEELRLPSPGI